MRMAVLKGFVGGGLGFGLAHLQDHLAALLAVVPVLHVAAPGLLEVRAVPDELLHAGQASLLSKVHEALQVRCAGLGTGIAAEDGVDAFGPRPACLAAGPRLRRRN